MIKVFVDPDDRCQQYWFHCPGCDIPHAFTVKPKFGTGWDFNNDLEKPTFSPSLLCDSKRRCHLFLKEGKIQFLNDCHHDLAGQTVDCPDWHGFYNSGIE